MLKTLINNIIRIFQYIPIIWNDRDWDFIFVFILLKYKIERILKHLKNSPFTTLRPKEEKRLKTILFLLDRLIKEDFNDNELDNLFKKFKPSLIGFNNRTKEEIAEFSRYFKKNVHIKRHHEELLFNLISKHYAKWWD